MPTNETLANTCGITADMLKAIPEVKMIDIGGYQWPRRASLPHNTRAELAIRDAVNAVESVGAHTLLTDAVILLQRAKDSLADYIDQFPDDEYNAVMEAEATLERSLALNSEAH